ncbi:MAG: imelysin family protein [Myxococcota bacterium]|nr:imelysin family protein [Myxococcota bacterium]
MNNIHTTIVLSFVAFGSACGEVTQEVQDTNEILEATVEETILPNVAQMVVTAESLHRLGQSFCMEPSDAGLENLRFAWSGGKRALKTIEVLGFGPYIDQDIDISRKLDNWPERGIGIEDLISGNATLDTQTLENINRADTSTGYPALGYLLHSHTSNEEIIEEFTVDARRCEYLLSLTQINLDVAERFENAWFEQGEDYASEIKKAGLGSSVFENEQEAIAVLLKGMIELSTKMSVIKLEQPLRMENEEALEASYSENSLLDLSYNIEAIEDLYMGSSLSLSDYFISHGGEDLDQQIQDAIHNARMAIGSIPEPLSNALYESPEEVMDASVALDTLASLLRNNAEEFAQQIQ